MNCIFSVVARFIRLVAVRFLDKALYYAASFAMTDLGCLNKIGFRYCENDKIASTGLMFLLMRLLYNLILLTVVITTELDWNLSY